MRTRRLCLKERKKTLHAPITFLGSSLKFLLLFFCSFVLCFYFQDGRGTAKWTWRMFLLQALLQTGWNINVCSNQNWSLYGTRPLKNSKPFSISTAWQVKLLRKFLCESPMALTVAIRSIMGKIPKPDSLNVKVKSQVRYMISFKLPGETSTKRWDAKRIAASQAIKEVESKNVKLLAEP